MIYPVYQRCLFFTSFWHISNLSLLHKVGGSTFAKLMEMGRLKIFARKVGGKVKWGPCLEMGSCHIMLRCFWRFLMMQCRCLMMRAILAKLDSAMKFQVTWKFWFLPWKGWGGGWGFWNFQKWEWGRDFELGVGGLNPSTNYVLSREFSHI